MTTSESRAKSVSDVFKASPFSVFEFFAKAGQGLYVPAYQRPYSWDKSNITRLVEDVAHGFKMLVIQPDVVTFLGTIIAINDTQHRTISPVVKGQVPSRVMTIIDGQQRLTSLLILCTGLHENLRLLSLKLKKDVETDVWLFDEVQRQLAELNKIFEEDQGYGAHRFYPKMIRSFVDQWSTNAQARYHSPLAWHLFKYGEHVRATLEKPKKFEYTIPADIDKQREGDHNSFKERLLEVQRALKVVQNGPKNTEQEEGVELPKWGDTVASKQFQQALLNQTEFPAAVVAVLQGEETDFHRALRTLLFSRFLLSRVGLTVVEATNEDSAFDLFEALNTTGEPLTAYETFKPKVIQQQKLEHFEQSQNYKYLSSIDEYLAQFKKTDEKQDATRDLVVSFALAESGYKLSRHLSEQRRYLRDRYESLEGDDEKLKFVRHLAQSASYVSVAWPSDASEKPSFGEFDTSISEVARICADMLRLSNHTITISPIARFYAAAVEAKADGDAGKLKIAVRDLEDAVKAIAAFWTLWRASRAGTESIDSHYRNLMLLPSQADEDGVLRFIGLARKPLTDKAGTGGEGLPPNAAQLKEALRSILKNYGKIENREMWVERARTQPATKTRAVTRFLLLSALHDSPADISTPGLNEKGVPGSVPLMTFENWRALHTLEHIAPGTPPKPTSDWDEKLYEENYGDRALIDTIGNLTLLPGSINSSISNRTWRTKNYLYRLLSSPSDQGFKVLLEKANEFSVSAPTEDLLNKKMTYLAQIDALAKVEGTWSLELVTARGTRLAELAYDRLSAWLE